MMFVVCCVLCCCVLSVARRSWFLGHCLMFDRVRFLVYCCSLFIVCWLSVGCCRLVVVVEFVVL